MPSESVPKPPSRRLKIGIDAHAIGQRATGNERFITGVLGELRGLCDHDFVLFFTSPEEAKEWALDGWETRLVPRNPLVRIGWSIPRDAAGERIDVLLVQYVASRRVKCPVVSVVHDVSFIEHPEWFSPIERLWMKRAIPATMEMAAAVITVSSFSRYEIIRTCGINPAKVHVAHDGVDPARGAGTAPASGVAPYFIYVGNLEPRKNVSTLLRAFAEFRKGHPDHRLVVVGHPKRGGRVSEQPGVEFAGYVPDDELASLTAGAVALCYPSFYEGFGLPPLEAMALGVPVIASDIPVMRELYEGAARLVPATDETAWTEAMSLLAADAGLRRELEVAGRERSAGFTWRKSAEAVLQALEQAALKQRD